MKRRFNLIFLIVPALLLITGCPRRDPVPEVEISRLEAEHAIIRARSEIHAAEEAGADVSHPREILDGAQSYFDDGNYSRAYEEALKASGIARELLAAQRSALDAEAAIERAQRLIDRAADLGGDVTDPVNILAEAREMFNLQDYPASIELADQAADMAREIIDRLTADTYTVGTWERDRDCLWNIAARERIYNDPWKWKRIYRANEDKIVDPDLIFPGQELIIPQD